MGVKDLWSILDPISEEITLQQFQGKSVAIDLSGWICDSQAIGQTHRSIQRPDLRNTFFRASRLVLSDVKPIFIMEGDAPKIKHTTIQQRNATQRPWQNSSQSSSKPRSQFTARMKPMMRLLDAMGLTYMQSSGEAEKLCAHLNKEKVVDAVISQDSDCLLYGATRVLRHFSVAKGSATARSYCMSRVEKELQLDREKLVVLALLLGCDYGQRGVHGVGREQAIAYLKGSTHGSPLQRLQSWRTHPLLSKLELERQAMSQPRSCPMCWHPGTERKHADRGCAICCTNTGCTKRNSVLQAGNANSQWQILELQIRAKALQDSEFPSEDIIQEFYQEERLRSQVKFEWKEPQVQQLLDIGTRQLGWKREESLAKALQLLARWQCRQLASRLCPTVPLQLKQIVKLRVQHGERCVEVEWAPVPGLAMTESATTLEPLSLFSQAYPQQWAHFEEDKLASKKSKRPRKAKESKVEAIPQSATARQDSLEDMMEQLELDESIAEHELSDIVYSIVSRSTQAATLGSANEYV